MWPFTATARYRWRVNGAIDDWAAAASQVEGTALRESRTALERLERALPPAPLADEHARLVEAWRTRFSFAQEDVVGRVGLGVEVRAASNHLAAEVDRHGVNPDGAYAAVLAEVKALTQQASARYSQGLDRESARMIERVERAKPPADRSKAHAELLAVLREYVEVQRQLFAAHDRHDRQGAVEAAARYGALRDRLHELRPGRP